MRNVQECVCVCMEEAGVVQLDDAEVCVFMCLWMDRSVFVDGCGGKETGVVQLTMLRLWARSSLRRIHPAANMKYSSLHTARERDSGREGGSKSRETKRAWERRERAREG